MFLMSLKLLKGPFSVILLTFSAQLALKEHSRNTQRALEPLKITPRELQGHSKGTWILKALQAFGHSGTWALEALDLAYFRNIS